MTLASEEKAPLLLVPELLEHRVYHLLCQIKVCRRKGRFKGIEERCCEEGIIIQIAVQLCLSILIDTQQPAIAQHMPLQESDSISHSLQCFLISQNIVGLHHAREHQTVPGGQNLFISKRFLTLLTNRKQDSLGR